MFIQNLVTMSFTVETGYSNNFFAAKMVKNDEINIMRYFSHQGNIRK